MIVYLTIGLAISVAHTWATVKSELPMAASALAWIAVLIVPLWPVVVLLYAHDWDQERKQQ